MSAVLIGQAEVHSSEWHALRAGGIGGSEIAAVVGLSPWTSPFALWHRKRGELGEQRQSEAMEWGTRLEPVIAAKFAEEHPEFDVQETPGTYAHESRSWQRCNPDGLLVGDETALLEVKTVNAFADDFTKTDIPVYYRCQIQWELDVFGLDRCYAAVLVGGNSYREYVIEADLEDQATLRTAAEAFWNSIAADEEPPLDATDHTYKAAVDTAEGELVFVKSEVLQYMGAARVARFASTDVLRRQLSSAKTPYLKEVS